MITKYHLARHFTVLLLPDSPLLMRMREIWTRHSELKCSNKSSSVTSCTEVVQEHRFVLSHFSCPHLPAVLLYPPSTRPWSIWPRDSGTRALPGSVTLHHAFPLLCLTQKARVSPFQLYHIHIVHMLMISEHSESPQIMLLLVSVCFLS